MFFHAPVYRHLVGNILKVYGTAGTINEGDVFVLQPPLRGRPAARLRHGLHRAGLRRRPASSAFAGSIAHKADVGGAVPGSTSANATEMFQEGLLVPPVKIWNAASRRRRHRSASFSPTAASQG